MNPIIWLFAAIAMFVAFVVVGCGVVIVIEYILLKIANWRKRGPGSVQSP